MKDLDSNLVKKSEINIFASFLTTYVSKHYCLFVPLGRAVAMICSSLKSKPKQVKLLKILDRDGKRLNTTKIFAILHVNFGTNFEKFCLKMLQKCKSLTKQIIKYAHKISLHMQVLNRRYKRLF